MSGPTIQHPEMQENKILKGFIIWENAKVYLRLLATTSHFTDNHVSLILHKKCATKRGPMGGGKNRFWKKQN